MQHVRQALHAAGIRPRGLDPLTLTDRETAAALTELSTLVRHLHTVVLGGNGDPARYYDDVGEALRAVGAYV